MAYLTLEQYERRSSNAARRNISNVELLIEQGVSGDIAELIADELASARHDFHISAEEIFNSESGYDTFNIFETLENGLSAINELCNTDFRITDSAEWTSDIDYYDACDDIDCEDERIEMYNEYFEQWIDEHSEINSTVEKAMRAVDEKYGTNICPTGLQRIF